MFRSVLLTLFFILSANGIDAQDTALWTSDINSLPDSVPLNPLKVMHDHNQNVYTLSNWYRGGDSLKTKIHLRKFDVNGNVVWTRIYENTGNGDTRAYDMAIDGTEIFVAGSYRSGRNEKPLLMRISTAGNLLWSRDSFLNFKTGVISQLIYFGNTLYMGGNGIACCDIDGNELWSSAVNSGRMAVDRYRRLLVCTGDSTGDVIERYTVGGVRNIRKELTSARRISSDYDNSIYVLSDLPTYVLEKYDSSGNFEWRYDKFPQAPPFGDIGFEIICDNSGNIYCIGLSDSIFKFNSHGHLVQKLSMFGTDVYIISAEITDDEMLMICGSYYNGSSYEIKVLSYNLLGRVNWQAAYNAPVSTQEFAVDMCISEYEGIYVLENLSQNGRLMKFGSPRQKIANSSDLCVSRINYKSNDSNIVDVEIFNGSNGFINYPSVRIVSPTGDTISNKSNKVVFFGQLSNSFQFYQDSIYRKDITDFRTCKVLMSLGFGDTTFELKWCDQSSMVLPPASLPLFSVYPNPFSGKLNIGSELSLDDVRFQLYDANGRCLYDCHIENGLNHLDTDLSRGLYFYVISDGHSILQSGKLISE